MGVLSTIKDALSRVGEFDRKLAYGDDYKQKAAVLTRLNEIKMRAALLENEDKFQSIQKIRQEMANDARTQRLRQIQAGVGIGVAQNPGPDPDVAGQGVGKPLDELDPNMILHTPGFGRKAPVFAGAVTEGLDSSDVEAMKAATEGGLQDRATKESQEAQELQSKLRANEALAFQRTAAGQKALQPPDSGGRVYPGMRGIKDGVYGQYAIGPDGMEWFPAPGFFPTGAAAPVTLRKDITGLATAFQRLSDISNLIAGATTIIGPGVGDVAYMKGKWVGGAGLTQGQSDYLNTLTQARMEAAFAAGGKQLTDTEKKFFDIIYPSERDTLPVVRAKLDRLMKALQTKARHEISAWTPVERGQVELEGFGGLFGGIPDDPRGGPSFGNDEVIDFDAEGNPVGGR